MRTLGQDVWRETEKWVLLSKLEMNFSIRKTYWKIKKNVKQDFT